MLRRNLKLTADMVAHKLAEKSIAFVAQHIVKAYSAADKYLFDSRQFLHSFQKLNILAVIRL